MKIKKTWLINSLVHDDVVKQTQINKTTTTACIFKFYILYKLKKKASMHLEKQDLNL